MRQYAIDQCDIYSWTAELPKSKLFLHIIDEQKNEDEAHLKVLVTLRDLPKLL